MENGRSDNDLNHPRKRDLDDLQNEIAGRETGRRKRFLVGGEQSPEERHRKREAEQALRTKLALMLADPAYRAKYDSVMDSLRSAEQAAEAAVDHIDIMIQNVEQELQQMADQAARLPDVSLVFRDADGRVRRADGSVVDAHLVDTVLWTGNEPTYEDYLAQLDLLEQLTNDRSDVKAYQFDVLGSARDRVTDPDAPPSLDDLDDIQDGLLANMPKAVRDHIPEVEAASAHLDTTSNIALPPITPEH